MNIDLLVLYTRIIHVSTHECTFYHINHFWVSVLFMHFCTPILVFLSLVLSWLGHSLRKKWINTIHLALRTSPHFALRFFILFPPLSHLLLCVEWFINYWIEAFVIHHSCKKSFGVNHMRKDLCWRVLNQLVWFIVRTSWRNRSSYAS